MSDKGTRVQLQLNEAAMTRLRLIEKLTGSNSHADVVRQALEILEWHVLERIGGAQFLSKDADGTVTKLQFFLDIDRTDVEKAREEIALEKENSGGKTWFSATADQDNPEDSSEPVDPIAEVFISKIPGLNSRQINACYRQQLLKVKDLGEYDVDTLSRLWGISRKSAQEMIGVLDTERKRVLKGS